MGEEVELFKKPYTGEDAQTYGYEYKNAQVTISYLFKISIIHALPAKEF